jgi:glycerophosphoryl diester phosphodiesterase
MSQRLRIATRTAARAACFALAAAAPVIWLASPVPANSLSREAPAAARPAGPATAPAVAGEPWTVRGHLPPEQFVIQSHRGAGDLAPENTLEAFELGWKMGTYPESDLRTTKDGVIVTFHDENFSRVVRGADEALKKKGVADLTWDELSKLDVSGFKSEQFHTHRVIKVSQAFEQMTGKPDRHLYMDIKNVDLAQLAKEVKAHKVERQVVLASTKYDLIRKWKALVPESDTLHWMGGTEDVLRKRIEDLKKMNFADITQLQVHAKPKPGVDPAAADPFTPSDAFLREVGEELRRRKIVFQSLPWGSDDVRAYWKLLDLGVMSFATDRPDVTKEAVRRYYAGEGNPAGGGKPAAGKAQKTGEKADKVGGGEGR